MRVLVEMKLDDFQSMSRAGFAVRMVRHGSYVAPEEVMQSVRPVAAQQHTSRVRLVTMEQVFYSACTLLTVNPQTVLLLRSREHRHVAARVITCGMVKDYLGNYSYPEIAEYLTGKKKAHAGAIEMHRRWTQMNGSEVVYGTITKDMATRHVASQCGLRLEDTQ